MMAASLLKGRVGAFCPSSSWLKLNIRHAVHSSKKSYYILLPEIPPDTAETNAVMRVNDLPRFSEITPGQCIFACAKLAIEYDVKLDQHLQFLENTKLEKTFANVYNPIEQISVPLNTAWATTKNLHYVNKNYRKAFSRVHPQVERAKNERWVSEVLYNAFKELDSNSHNLTEEQQRIVDLYLLESRLNGIELSTKKRQDLFDTLKEIGRNAEIMRENIRKVTRQFSLEIKDPKDLEEMPANMRKQMLAPKADPEKGPWIATVEPNNFQGVMKYCSNRMQRWNAWSAYHNRSSGTWAAEHLNNNLIIDFLRDYRSDVAKLLGYDNYVELSMETKMAGSLDNVIHMIEALKGRFGPVLWEEVATLQEFARSEGFTKKLEMWDMVYWFRRQREHLYGVDQDKVPEYFPLDNVLKKLFDFCTELFDITFEEKTSEVDVWHPDVQFFNVIDEKGNHVSSFYIDPYHRGEKITIPYMDMGRENSPTHNVWPYSYISLQIQKPEDGKPALMRFEDIESLFSEFGNGLQQMLSKAPYGELSGQKNIEWDAVAICSKFMKQWLMLPEVVKTLSGHHSNGEPIPDELLLNTLKFHYHTYNYDMMFQLFVSAYDLDIHVTNKSNWKEFQKNLWSNFMPLPLDKQDNLPCSMNPIFSGMYPASYYSHKWSEMIAADLLAAFREVGLHNTEEIKVLGKRFRDTYLSLGGSIPASEVFRRFRGRDPSTDALQPPFFPRYLEE